MHDEALDIAYLESETPPDPRDRAACLAWAFARFARFCGLLQIQPVSGGGRIPMVLSPIQRQYNAKRTTRDIILKPRQVFMTTLEAARDLWWFLVNPGSRVVLVCQSQTEMAAIKDLSEKFRIFIDALRKLGMRLDFGRETGTEWTLPDQDSTMRIVQAGASENSASKKGRGGTVNRLHISEAAFFENAEATFNSLMESVPMTGSEVVVESTPNGASGFYYEQWQAAISGDSAYTPHFFEWWKHPHYRIALPQGVKFTPETPLERTLIAKGVPVECLNWYRSKIREKGGNPDLVAQEFPSDPDTCFLLTGRPFFDVGMTAKLLAGAKDPIETKTIRGSGAMGQMINKREVPALRIWHKPEKGMTYVVAVDTSEGTGGDAGCAIVLEKASRRHMATLWGQFKPPELALHASELGLRYGKALLAVERANHGSACLLALQTLKYPNLFRDRDGKYGWLNVDTTRTPALDALEAAQRSEVFTTLDHYLIAEMRTFVYVTHGSLERGEAGRGAHDDLVMASAIAWDLLRRPAMPRGMGQNQVLAF